MANEVIGTKSLLAPQKWQQFLLPAKENDGDKTGKDSLGKLDDVEIRDG